MNRVPDSARRRTMFFHVSIGSLATALGLVISLVTVPIVIRMLGMEAFGLIGFSASLQAALRILDLGLTPTLIRELAGRSTAPLGAQLIRDFTTTLAWVFAGVSVAVGVLVAVAAPWLATSWIRAESLPTPVVSWAIVLIGLSTAIQWMASYFHCTLLGLEQQSTLSIVRLIETTAASLGGIALVLFFDGAILHLLAWQATVAAAALIALVPIVRNRLPASPAPPRFRWESVRRVGRFAGGMTAITVTGLILTHMDKILLSRVLPLGEFGDYSLAFFAIAAVQAVAVVPMVNVMLPRFSALAAAGDLTKIETFHRLTTQTLLSVTAPFIVILTFFARDLLEVVTRDSEVAATVSAIAVVLSLGLALNCIVVAPYTLQLALGRTRLAVVANSAFIVVFAPLLYLLAIWYGPVGAAANYALLNVATVIVWMSFIHHRVPSGRFNALAVDVGRPALVSLAAAAGLWALPIGSWPISVRLAFGGAVSVSLVLACACACPLTRGELRARVVSRSDAATARNDAESRSEVPNSLPEHS